MTKRKILAVATLAALPLFIGAPRSVPEPAATPTEVVHRLQAMDGHARSAVDVCVGHAKRRCAGVRRHEHA